MNKYLTVLLKLSINKTSLLHIGNSLYKYLLRLVLVLFVDYYRDYNSTVDYSFMLSPLAYYGFVAT